MITNDNQQQQQQQQQLQVLICTANMGNAKPTQLDTWIPSKGRLQNVKMNIIVIGMQEATWKPSKNDTDAAVTNNSFHSSTDDVEDTTEEDSSAIAEAGMINTTTTTANNTTPKNQKNNFSGVVTSGFKAQVSGLKAQVSGVSDLTGKNKHDSILLRDTINETLGAEYKLIQEFQRGQMRLYLYVAHPWVEQVKDLDVKAENTGIAHVYHNKGGIIVQFTIQQTRLSFLTAHLAAHEGIDKYKARNDNLREIWRGARPNPKHLLGYDAATISHHTFVFGDLNYRVRVQVDDDSHEAKVAKAMELVQAKDFETLYAMDELTAGIDKKELLFQFQTPPCHFSPTFKMLREPGFHYKAQRVPSYTDRILFASAENLSDKLKNLVYEPCPDFASSDHKPIRGVFSIDLNRPTTVTESTMTEPVSLVFRDISCKDLPPMDVDGSSDPYVLFVCDPVDLVQDDRSAKERKGKSYKVGSFEWPSTAYRTKTLNPTWDEKVKLHVPSVTASRMDGAMLFLTVMDYDVASQDDTICVLQLNLKDLVTLGAGEKSKTVAFSRPLLKYGQQRGTIDFTVDIRQEGSENAGAKGKRGGFFSRLSKKWSRAKMP